MTVERYRMDFITCPYCDHAHEDMCDYPWGENPRDGDEWEFECASCEKEFTVELHMDHSFSSFQKEADND